MKRPVFFISDRTGMTAETYGSSLLAQFVNHQFDGQRLSFIDSEQKALNAAKQVELESARSGLQAIVFSTLDPSMQQFLDKTNACVISLLDTFIAPLEDCLGEKSAHTQGIPLDLFGNNGYQRRLDAIDYALAHDDGVRAEQYDKAEVILLGVSRCGKTPVSLYLAINYSIRAANYPITENEIWSEHLPKILQPQQKLLVGLTIDPLQLSKIREKRRPGSEYAALTVCKREVKAVETMFTNARIAVFDTTEISIEEISAHVITEQSLRKH